MSQIIKIKSGTSGQPDSLARGELAINVSNGAFYYGDAQSATTGTWFFSGASAETFSATTTVIDTQLNISGNTFFEGALSGTGAITTVGSISTDGDLTGDNALIRDNIRHVGDTTTGISFGNGGGEIDFRTNNDSRIDLTNSGVRLGGANSRVTTILDEDNMASDSDTSLSTQQSIKAYVDSQVSTSDTLQEVTDNGATTTNAIQLGSNLGISGNTFFEGALSGTGAVTVLGNITTDGDVTTDNALIRDNIQHVGDLTNEISFAANSQDFRTNNTSRLDISNSGVRLGGANSRVTTILDEDAMGTNSDTALATQQSIKAYSDTKLPLAGGTMSGSVDFGDNDITNVDSLDTDKFSIAGGTEMTSIKDEDNMASDSNVALATQQSIKAYVDSQVATSDTLQEVTDNGATTTNALQFGSNLGISGDTFFEGSMSGTGSVTVGGFVSTGLDVKVGTNLQVSDNIQHVGDLTNEISFATNTQDFRTNNGSRLDIDTDGVRLGGANSRVTTILDEDAMGTNSATALATQQSIKAYSDTKLPLAGGTMSGSINLGDNDITNIDSLDTDKFSIASGTEMTSIKDEDNMASDSNVALATQQSIKAYVDSQVATSDTLQEVTDNGTTTTNALQFGSNLGISGDTFFEGALSGTGAISSVGNISTDGDVTTDNALIRENIQHVGDTTNEISFASATQDFRTNNSSRLDISNSGVRLGGANSRVTTILDEDAMGTNSDTALATQQSIKAYSDTKLPLAGGTMSGNVDFGDNDITNVDSFDADKLSIAGGTEMTSIKDEDNMASDSNVALATQQSIKAYVDGQVGGSDTLQEVTDNGATTTNAIQLGSNLGISGNTFFEGTLSGTGAITSVGQIASSGNIIAGAEIKAGTNLQVSDNIQHVGDTTNEISFATNTQDFRTNNGSRLDINDDGVRLGGANSRVTTILDEDAMGTNSATALATQQSIKAYSDTKLPLAGGAMTGAITTNSTFDGRDVAADGVTADAALPRAGGTMSGSINLGDNDITNIDSLDTDKFSIAGGTEMTSIKDEDNMASDSNVALATQQSIKAYVDSQVATSDTLQEVTDNGATTTNAIQLGSNLGVSGNTFYEGAVSGTGSVTAVGGFVGDLTGNASTSTKIASIDNTDIVVLAGAQTLTGTKTLNSFKGTGSVTVTNILDEDAMGTNSDTALATQQSIKAYADLKLPLAGGAMTGAITTNSTFDGRDVAADGVTADAALPRAGGTMSGNVNFGDNDITNVDSFDADKLSIAGGTEMTSIKDEDNMASDSNVALATQQSIKAYVDSQVATSDTLQEVTDNGTTTTNALQFGSNLGISGNTFFEGTLSGTGSVTAIGAISSVGSITTDGDLTGNNALIRANIQHVGDLTNEISFASATQDFRTNNNSRLDISNSGVRLGGANSRVTTILDEDNMASDSNTALSTQQSIKAYADTKLPLAGGTMSGSINLGDNDITNVDSLDTDKFSIAGGTEMTSIKDEDNMASDSNVALATQQSIKAYVDSQVATSDTLQEVTDNGATTTNALQFGSNLGISGDTFFEGSMSGTGNVTLLGNVTSGNVKASGDVQVGGNIQHIGDLTNEISFADATQDFRTNNTSRLDISNDGVRLGGANSRVTTILDEDNMSSDSNRALSTQQSIKAYSDTKLSKAGGAMTGAITTNSTFDGRDVAADGVTADAALPRTGGAMTGAITTNSTFDGRDVAADGVTADAALPRAGGTMSGNVDFGDNDITNVDSFDTDKLSIAGGTEMTSIKDEDNMASDSNVALATQQSIKAYVDAQGGTGTLQSVTDNGTTTTNALQLGSNLGISGNTFFEGALSGSGTITAVGNIVSGTDIETARNLLVSANIQHVGDTTNEISFASAAQDFRTNNGSRLDISNSGVRLGGANSRVTTILDEDAMGTNSNTALATQQSIKAYSDTKLPLAGGTMSGSINLGDNDITNVDSFDADKLSIAGGTEMTSIKDEDNMASDSNVALATQQSIKAYVDSQVATSDTLQEVTDNGTTTTNALQFGSNLGISGNTFFEGSVSGTGSVTAIGGFVGDVTGNASTATKLAATKTIGGVAFDGSANINLPGVNTAGNQNTSGTAAEATILENTRTIGGVSFNGSANIDLPGVNTAGNQDTSGNAATATILATARNIGGVSFNGSANIDLPGVNTAGNQNTSGLAATATILATARTIGGVSFNGSANIDLPGVNTSGNQDTSGNADTSTKIASITNSNIVQLAGAQTLTGTKTLNSFKGTGSVTVTNILDEDNMASNSDTALATQQSIRAYVTSQVGASDTLQEVTDNGATTTNSITTAGLTSNGTVTVGVDDTGYDVKFFGATSGQYMLWDESADKLIVTGEIEATKFDGALEGNADTATVLATARNIGGVSFNGSANIDLPGVNTAGNQNTSGLAATATILATARNIGGVSFNGSANIDLPGVNTSGNQDTSGTAAEATILATARNIGGVSFDGSGNINLPGVNTAGNQNTSGTAAISTTVTITDNESTNENNVITFAAGAAGSGNLGLEADGNLTYNPSTGKVTATGFVGDVTGDISGNAATATILATARNIGGVSFNGSANIDLPGVNTGGNQDTSGNAATSTKIASITNTNIVQLAGAQTLTGTKTLNSFKGTGSVTVTDILDEDNMASNSATALATQQSIKAYVDASVPSESDTLQDVTSRGATSNVAITLSNTFTVGADDTGHDVKFFGATSGQYMLWDESADKLIVTGEIEATKFDGALEGNADTATILATARNIGGVSFNGSANINLPGVNTAGNQNTSGNAATATILATARNIGGVSFNGSANIDLPGVNSAGNQDTSGTAAVATVATTVTLTDESSDTTCFPVFSQSATGNQAMETGSNLTFNSSSGLLTATLLAGDLTGDVTGNADTATILATARNIGGVSFNGSANIDLPGVNSSGNQNTSGNAATATILATARNIGGVSFNGSANINLPGVNTAGNQDTSGNAATSTKIASITNSDIVQLGGAQTLTGTKTLNSFKGTGSVTVTNILDEDNMASNSATALATQQSIKAYVDASVPSESDTLQTVTERGATSNQAITLSNTFTVGVDDTGHDVKFFGDDSGEYMFWDTSSARLEIKHTDESVGLEVYTNAAATTTQPQLKVGRSSSQYWGVYTDDRNAHLVHRQDETSGEMTTRFDQWDSNTSDTTGNWLWRFGNGSGGSMAEAMKLTQAGLLTVSNVTGDLTGDVTGNADTATILATTRTIGGVSFNGSANINLPGVNTAGNQNTSGVAATATILATARNIGGVSFNGSANINLPGVNTSGNQNTSGNAATATLAADATTLATARNIGGVSFDGSANIDLPGVNSSGNQDTSGNADTATKIASITNSNIVQLAGAQTLTGTKTLNSFKGTGAVTVTNILDEDNMASNSATALATQQSIKAYVDSASGESDTLQDVTSRGATSNVAITLSNDFTVGVNGTGHDVKFFGDTSGQYMLWDQSADKLIVTGEIEATKFDGALEGNADTATILATARNIGGVSFNGSANIDLPGVNTAGNQNTSGNAATATILASTRTIGGVSFNGSANIDLPGVNTAGNQNTSGLAATATILATARNIGGVSFNGSANIDLPGVNSAGNQNTSGTAAIATTVTVTDESTDTTCFPIFSQSATGNVAMETGSNLTFNSSSGLLTATLLAGDLTGDVTGDVTGNASTATKLAATKTIGGVAFDGSANINLPGVNTAGNQNTSGLAATATILATARNIGGVSFNGSANIDLPGVNSSGNQDTSGNADTATKIASITNSNIVQLAGAQTLTGTKTLNSFKGTGSVTVTNILDEDNMASNSATALATQQSIKAYVDNASGESDTLQTVTERGATSNQAITLSNTFTVGVDDTGHDVKFFGATSGQYMLWDQSADKLIVTGEIEATKFDGALEGNADTATILATARNIGGVSFNGSANIDLPGVNTAGNQNTSGVAATATILATARNIGGVSFNGSANIDLPGVNTAGNQNTSGLAATATILATARNIGGVSFNGSANIDLPGVNSSGNQDTSGTAAVATVATTVTLTDESTDTTCFPVFAQSATGNVAMETGSNLTFNSSSGLLTATLLAGDLTGDVTGNADTATKLAATKTIGGVAFDGSANINLPGVNTAGNQNTSGLAATATILATARNIGGVSFNGSANIDLPGVNTSGNQDTSGNADTATKIASITNSNIVQLAGAQTLTGTKTLNSFKGTGSVTVTDIKDTDNFSDASSTSLATSESIKAYVDNATGESDTLQTVTSRGATSNVAITLSNDFTVGTNGTGHDVKFFGDTSGQYMLWDQSADKLIVTGEIEATKFDGALEGNADTATVLATARNIGGVSFNGSANIDLPGVNTAGNQNTSGLAATATILATARNIGGVSFNGSANIDLPGVNSAGNQNTSGNAATATLAADATTLATARNIGGVSFDGSANIDLPGVNSAGNQNTSGTAAIATTVTLTDESSDTTCFPVFSQTATGNRALETGSNLTFNSSSGLLTATLLAGDLTGDVTGNADTATVLATARNIGGVSFNGSANIDLPGVNTAGNQNTSGLAATATILATARNIGGVSFNGSANINLPGVNTAGNQNTSGTAAVATTSTNVTVANEGTDTTCFPLFVKAATGDLGPKTNTNLSFNADTDTLSCLGFSGNFVGDLTGDVTGNADTATVLETARTIGGVSFNGSANINLPGVNTSGNQNTSGLAATATILATARNIGGVSFNGSANINLPGVNTAGNQDTSGTAAVATNVTAVATTDNTEFFVGVLDGASGSQVVETSTKLKQNPSTGKLSVDGIIQLDGGTTAASPTPQLKFSNYYDNSGGPSISHIDLYAGTYGFGVTSADLDYVTARNHKFYTGGDTLAAMTINPDTYYTGVVGVQIEEPKTALDVHHNPTNLANNTGGGEVVTFGTASGSLTAGKLYYLNTSGVWTLTRANASSSNGNGQLLGIALGTAVSSGILLRGFFDMHSYFTGTFNEGIPLYVCETTSGNVNVAAPGATNEFVRVVGYCTNTANTIYFNPDGTYITVA